MNAYVRRPAVHPQPSVSDRTFVARVAPSVCWHKGHGKSGAPVATISRIFSVAARSI